MTKLHTCCDIGSNFRSNIWFLLNDGQSGRKIGMYGGSNIRLKHTYGFC